MDIHLSPRHLRLTPAIKQHFEAKVRHLEGLAGEIVSAHVVLAHDEAADPADRHCVKVQLALPGPDIHAEETDASLYAALDLVISKLARQLRKRKTRLTDKGRSDTAKIVRRSKRSAA